MPEADKTRGNRTQGYRFMGLGLEFAAAVAGLSLLGYWVDRHYGTSPWGLLIGALLGLIGGLNNFVRGGLVAAREAAEEAAGKTGETTAGHGEGADDEPGDGSGGDGGEGA